MNTEHFWLKFGNNLTVNADNILIYLKHLEHRELRQGATSEWCRLGWSLIKLPGKLNEPDCAEHLWFRIVTHDLMVDPLFLWQTLFKDRVETFLGQHTSISLWFLFRICKRRERGSLSKDFIRQGSNIPNNTIPAVASYEKCRRRDQIFPSLVWMSALGGIQPPLKQTKSHRGLENDSRGSLSTTNIKYPIMRSLSWEN